METDTLTLPSTSSPVLSIEDLDIRFSTGDGPVHAVRGLNLRVGAGECLGVVGESGSGKSQTFLAAMGLIAANGRAEGSVKFSGREILGLGRTQLNAIRGSKMSMIFQDPLTALTPHLRIGDQIAEGLRAHQGLSDQDARRRAREWLERVRIGDADRRLRQYPHELSGGMRQRVMIAAAMACAPDLLIADEPTTALDVTVQAEILDLMADLKADTGAAMILITHDMGVIARLADRVAVMREGRLVEEGDVGQVFAAPREAYTQDLLAAIPRLDGQGRGDRPLPAPVRPDAPIVVQGDDLKVWFPVRDGLFTAPRRLRAVDGVSLEIRRGETLGVVGESGCGKSTLARAIVRLLPPSSGAVTLMGRDITAASARTLQGARKDLQVVFQDPLASLDPRMTVGESIGEPLRVFRTDLDASGREARTVDMMARAGLDRALLNRYPHELSGGQNQRAGIARAMILQPGLVVCDEAVSALDVSVRATIIDLLIELQASFGMAMMFISHDLAVVREISHRVMVLYLGRVMELAERDEIFARPRHPYTQALMEAVPVPDPVVERARIRRRLVGEPPSPLDPLSALRFMPSRRPAVIGGAFEPPGLRDVGGGHLVAEFDTAFEDVVA